MDIFDFSDGREGYYGEYGGVFLLKFYTQQSKSCSLAFVNVKQTQNSGKTTLPYFRTILDDLRQLLI